MRKWNIANSGFSRIGRLLGGTVQRVERRHSRKWAERCANTPGPGNRRYILMQLHDTPADAINASGLLMSRAQRERYVRSDVDRMEDDGRLAEWLPEVVSDLRRVEVGVFRCRSGVILCGEGACDDECGCCETDALWESPINARDW